MWKNEPDEDVPDDSENWELAERAVQGDEDAYGRLIAKYQTPIHRFVFRSVQDEETARDLAQEVFVKAWFALAKAKRRGRFTTWLFQIAVNLCRDYARSKAARNLRLTSSLDVGTPGVASGASDLVSPGPTPDQRAASVEDVAALDREIGALPVKLRESFLLGAVDGRPAKEVAHMLGISPKAVETRIRRARQLLATRFDRRAIIPFR